MTTSRASGWLVAIVLVAGCHVDLGAGEFGDDAGSDEGSIPDLPAPECDPRQTINVCADGEKCSYVDDPSWGPTNRCVPVLGDKLEGESCSMIGDSDDCSEHRICWATDADGSDGICVGFCDSGLACEIDTDMCSVANDGLLPLCLPRCDPLLQDCVEGWGCYPDPKQRWVCDLDRSGEALGAHGDPCTCLNCCDPGFTCTTGVLVDAEGCGGAEGASGCCTAICMLDDGDPVDGVCPTELERCEPFYEPDSIMLGFEQVGICEL